MTSVSISELKARLSAFSRRTSSPCSPRVTPTALPFYTMPYVDGESLRARLVAARPLAVDESVRDPARRRARARLRARARRGASRHQARQHPDRRAARRVVTDFGIAKAISAARTEALLDIVRQGEDAAATDRGRPVARLSPVRAPARGEPTRRVAAQRPPAGALQRAARRLLEAPATVRRGGALARGAARGTGRGPVRFWDSSALVPLCLDQPRQAEALTLAREDAEMVVWWGSAIECASAIARTSTGRICHLRRGTRRARAAGRAGRELVRDPARQQPAGPGLRVLRLHPLRAADALQLAAALEWSGPAGGGVFVSFDDRLRAAAEREGF